MAVSWCPGADDFTDLFSGTMNAASCVKRDGTVEENAGFEQMRRELAGLALLYDIPFSYLVPAEEMLKQEELRFFHLDRNWIRALLDGAFGIGRHMGLDVTHDRKYLEDVYDTALAASMNVRSLMQNREAEPMRNALLLAKEKRCTGFLLRSALVRGWRGLEFQAYGDLEGKETLKALRLETLSEDVLLGIYRGVIARLDIMQPPEGFHFGFNGTDGRYTKRLRSLTTGRLDEAGTTEAVVYQRNHRVIDVLKTSEDMKQKLGMKEREPFTSAHLALQMIQNAYMAEIVIKEEADESNSNGTVGDTGSIR